MPRLARQLLYVRPFKTDRWTVGVLIIGPDGGRTLTEVERGLTTADAQRWLDARRVARAAAAA